MTEGASKARLFAALDLPEEARTELARWVGTARGVPGVRLLPAESFHVTLCFLGWRDEVEAAPIAELVAGCASPVPGLTLGRVAWLPPRRPRVLAAELVDGKGALAGLQGRLSSVLAAEAGYEPEKRRYRPHVTVARLRGGPDRPPALRAPAPVAFAGTAVTLYRSHLGRAGARYEAVSRTPI